MRVLVGMLLFFMALVAILLVSSIGLAFLLHWWLPDVGLEMALLIAVVIIGQSMIVFGRLLGDVLPVVAEEEARKEEAVYILDREIALPQRRRRRN